MQTVVACDGGIQMKFKEKWRVPAYSGLLTCLVFGLVAAIGATQKPTPKKNHRVHIVAWANDAKLSRKLTDAEIKKIKAARKKDDKRPIPAYKTVAGVKTGANLEVPDILETKKQIVAIQGGELTYTKLAPGTRLKYVTINPTSMVRSQPAELHVSIEKGKAQFRVGTLAQSSLIKAMGPMLATAAKGTAYSVAVQGQKTTLIVAEGKVEIYMESAPGAAITVSPREKVVYTAGDPFPEQPVDITPAEEQEIRELLSLPVQNLFGYESGRDIRRPDAENIVVTNVEYINRSVDGASMNSYKPSWKTPERVYFTANDNFWTTDASGAKTNVGKGLYFEGLSPDGKTIFASKPNAGLWRMDWSGANKVQVTKRAVGGVVSIAPNGQRLVAQEGWHQVAIMKWDKAKQKMVPTGKKRWITTSKLWVGVDVPRKVTFALNKSGTDVRYVRAYWRQGGKRLIAGLFVPGGGQFVDADKTPVKPLISIRQDVDRWKLSPSGKWLYGPDEGASKFVRLSDGMVFPHAQSDAAILMLGEKNIQLQDKIVEIESPGSPGRAPTADDQAYPNDPTDVSPNGEILAFRGEDAPYLATFADSLNLARSSTSAVAVSLRTQRVSWLSGNRVLYETPDWERVRNQILTLGVKRSSGTSKAGDNENVAPENVASLPLLDLLGKTHEEAISKLGPPVEKNEFNSLFVVHLHYDIRGLGHVKLMYTMGKPGTQDTWLHRVEIDGSGRFSDQAWATKLGINLSDRWAKDVPDRKVGGAYFPQRLYYPDSSGRRYTKGTSAGTIELEFGHDPLNASPNKALVVLYGLKEDAPPTVPVETNRFFALFQKQRPEIEKELGKPRSVVTDDGGGETCTYNLTGTSGVSIYYVARGGGLPKEITHSIVISFPKGTVWKTAVDFVKVRGQNLQPKPMTNIPGMLEITGHAHRPHLIYFSPENTKYPNGKLVNPQGLPQLEIE